MPGYGKHTGNKPDKSKSMKKKGQGIAIVIAPVKKARQKALKKAYGVK